MSEQRIYLDLSVELRNLLERSSLTIPDLLRQQGYDLALDVRPGELPGFDEFGRERGVGTVLMATAALALSLGAAASMVIMALSKFYSEREQAPVLIETYRQETVIAPDGSRQVRLVKDQEFRVPDILPSASEIGAGLNLTEGVTVRFRTEKNASD